MKWSRFLRSKPKLGWQGRGGEPSPVFIGAIVALVIAGAYAAIMIFGHKG